MFKFDYEGAGMPIAVSSNICINIRHQVACFKVGIYLVVYIPQIVFGLRTGRITCYVQYIILFAHLQVLYTCVFGVINKLFVFSCSAIGVLCF